MADAAQALPKLDNTFGAYLIGTFFSLILYGVNLLQLYRYERLYPNDSRSIRILVTVVMILETFHIVLLIHSCYFYLVSNYAMITALTMNVWSLNLTPVVSALITFVAQIFFARRVSLIGTSYKILVGIAGAFLLAHIGFAIGITIKFFDGEPANSPTHRWLNPAAVGSATIADFLLSFAIIITLVRSRENHRRSSDGGRFDAFVLYIIKTGLLTGILNGIPFILALASPTTLVWAAVNAVAARLYAITLFAVLNSRTLLVSRGVDFFEAAPLGRNILARANHLAAAERWNVPQLPAEAPPVITIKVQAETETHAQGGAGAREQDYKSVADSY